MSNMDRPAAVGSYEITKPPTSAEVEERLYSALVRRVMLSLRVSPPPDSADDELMVRVNAIERMPDGGLSVRGLLVGRRQAHISTSPDPERPASIRISKA